MKKLLGVAVLFGLLAIGCEDDPILQPNQAQPSEGGSYSKIHIDSGAVRTPVEGIDPASNPETF